MKKITKSQKISLIIIIVLVFSAFIYFINRQQVLAQTSGTSLATPKVQNQVYPGGVMLSWTIPNKGTVGFKIERKTMSVLNRKIIAILNPAEVGYQWLSKNGFYTDETVQKGTTYVYFVTTFDRQGNESAAGSATVTAQ